ncbi:MAG: glycerol-3-phosphate 1-O-acyltransferase PlsY [Nitrospiraceae bacterium]|nr:glycerol-3-phosphate 1-O-acyltransferase PlsY [Nitrospiraceae bacterium]
MSGISVIDSVLIAGSYLAGSIPFGLIIGRMLGGVDVRSVGSGNIGATNVLRAAGKKAAALTLVADCLKGLFAVMIAFRVADNAVIPFVAGAASVIGHNFPVFLGFKGGKGVATSIGVLLAVAPLIAVICLAVWLAAALIWRYSSLAGLLSFAAFPALVFATRPDEKPLAALSLFLFGMMYYRHRENIKRLLAGTESKIGQKK